MDARAVIYYRHNGGFTTPISGSISLAEGEVWSDQNITLCLSNIVHPTPAPPEFELAAVYAVEDATGSEDGETLLRRFKGAGWELRRIKDDDG